MVGELLKQASWQEEPPLISHFRTHDGVEVDAIIERADARIAAVEVKAGSQVRPADLCGLHMLPERLGARSSRVSCCISARWPTPSRIASTWPRGSTLVLITRRDPGNGSAVVTGDGRSAVLGARQARHVAGL